MFQYATQATHILPLHFGGWGSHLGTFVQLRPPPASNTTSCFPHTRLLALALLVAPHSFSKLAIDSFADPTFFFSFSILFANSSLTSSTLLFLARQLFYLKLCGSAPGEPSSSFLSVFRCQILRYLERHVYSKNNAYVFFTLPVDNSTGHRFLQRLLAYPPDLARKTALQNPQSPSFFHFLLSLFSAQ